MTIWDLSFKADLSAIAVSPLLSSPHLTGFFQALLPPVPSLHTFYSSVLLYPVRAPSLSLTFKAITHQQLGTNIIQVFEVKTMLELDQVLISTPAFPIELHKGFTELEL